MEQDARIPVLFGQQPGADDMVLLEEGQPAPAHAQIWRFSAQPTGHLPGCVCCGGRSAVAAALGALFRARATAAVPYFQRLLVVASPEGQRAVAAALTEDALCRARFHEAQGGQIITISSPL